MEPFGLRAQPHRHPLPVQRSICIHPHEAKARIKKIRIDNHTSKIRANNALQQGRSAAQTRARAPSPPSSSSLHPWTICALTSSKISGSKTLRYSDTDSYVSFTRCSPFPCLLPCTPSRRGLRLWGSFWLVLRDGAAGGQADVGRVDACTLDLATRRR